jgi:KAP family P-loop domain
VKPPCGQHKWAGCRSPPTSGNAWKRSGRAHGSATSTTSPLGTSPTLTPKRLIARFDPDRGTATDSLWVQRYVDAFARVAASRALTPPLSVGIFGDWGTGKTFFMERVEAKINQPASGEEGADEDLYVHNVCQIRFNA